MSRTKCSDKEINQFIAKIQQLSFAQITTTLLIGQFSSNWTSTAISILLVGVNNTYEAET